MPIINDYIDILRLSEDLRSKQEKYKEVLFFEYIQKYCFSIINESNNRTWIFKGHSNSDWKLQTMLERSINTYDPDTNKYDTEQELIREFKRKSPNLLKRVPKDNNILEWLSLMRHFGSPCRLLDFTYSFYVALFFAIEQMIFTNDVAECAIYAINNQIFNIENLLIQNESNIKENIIFTTENSDRIIKDFIFDKFKKTPFVFNISPYILNKRITIQQGTFLIPWYIEKSFEDNLVGNFLINNISENEGKKYIIKFIICMNRNERREIIHELHRMNINLSTLYPGIEGFSKSLGIRMEVDR